MEVAPNAGCTTDTISYSYIDCSSSTLIAGLSFDPSTQTFTCGSDLDLGVHEVCYVGEIGLSESYEASVTFELMKL